MCSSNSRFPSRICRISSIQPKMNLGTWNVRSKLHYFSGLILIALFTTFLLKNGNNGRIINNQELRKEEPQIACNKEQKQSNEEKNPQFEEGFSQNGPIPGCNLFSGKWIFENVSYPLYEEAESHFVQSEFRCEKNGRKDRKYQRWRWQPHECDLPRFDGKAFLEKIRGKKVLFVGDSLNRNQWASLLSLIEPSMPASSSKAVMKEGNMYTFQTAEYNATIGFYWSPFLVESNCDDPEIHRIKDRTIRIEAIEKHARNWNDADILIFNSFLWWIHPTMKIMWGSFESPDAIVKTMDTRLRLFEMALTTWSDWLEININRTKTNLFFMSLSPYHVQGEIENDGLNCYNVTEPIFKEGYRGFNTDVEMMRIAESAIEKLETRGLKMQYLNITQLSDYRKDAHLSIYRKYSLPSREELLKHPTSYSDCVHWCLPGLPDVWNEILYSYVMNS